MAHYILNNFVFNFVKFLAFKRLQKIPLTICEKYYFSPAKPTNFSIIVKTLG